MSTKLMVSWYFAGVMFLLLCGQQFLLTRAHAEAVTLLGAQYEKKLASAQTAPAVAAVPAPATVAATATPAATQSQEAAAPVQVAATSPASSRPLRAVPVSLAFRSQPFLKGKIVLVSNPSRQKLSYNVSVTRPSTGARRTFVVNVAPSAEIRLAGSDEGWTFASGDKIEIAHSGFESRTTAIP